ncbi:MAG: helix-turn-helix domain-containing protein [Rhodothalassiaceae bacterium]
MLHARLREIRKAKGLTLQQVADRVKPHGTTAQTIGRLETGARTLSVDWVQRIAEAMDVDPAELLALPQGGDLLVGGQVKPGGEVLKRDEGVLALRLSARDPIAVRLGCPMGPYREGDTVVCEKLDEIDWPRAVGADCYIEDVSGRGYFAKAAPGVGAGTLTLLPLDPSGVVRNEIAPALIAPAVTLVRPLSR